jgi:hypothetical protein
MGGDGERARSGGRPWTTLLDPVVNARVIAEIQAEGLRAAGELVDRMARSVDGEQSSCEFTGPGEAAGASSSDASQLIDAWIELLQRFSGSRTPSADARPHAEPSIDVQLGTDRPGEPLRLRIDATGATRSGPREIWLHNGTPVATGHIALHCSKLRSSDGDRLLAVLRFDPAEIDALPGRSGRGFALRIAPKGDLVPGSYRGVIQARGAPEAWMAVEVVVDGASAKS